METQAGLTLQSRIVAAITALAVILISVFTLLLVNNQLKTLTQHNIFKAKLGAMLARYSLEDALSKPVPPQKQVNILSEALDSLKQSGIAENIDLLNRQGEIVASSDKYSRGIRLPMQELRAIGPLFQEKNQPQVQIDRQKRLILQYVPIRQLLCPIDNTQAQAQQEALTSQPDKMPPLENIAYIAKISYSTGNINQALKQSYVPCIIIAIVIFIASFGLSVALSKMVLGPLKILNNATKEISSGKLQLRVNLPTGDEIEEVANTFNDMTAALVRMKERAENANPLTKLPGNNVIHEEIEKRIRDKRKFVVVYSDLDNFKAFNDKYGIGAGDQAIRLTSALMLESLKSGNTDDFLGHEGGDDFVLLTTPEKSKAVTDYITSEFDKRVRALYNKEDLERGYIIAKSREGQIRQFPIMTLSIAGVSNINQPLTSYGQITNICAAVKKVAKKTPGSVFVLDKTEQGAHPPVNA